MQALNSMKDLEIENMVPKSEDDYSTIIFNFVCNCPMTFDVDTLKVYDNMGYIADLEVVEN